MATFALSRRTLALFRLGFAAHLALVTAIGAAAYLQALPSVQVLHPEADKVMHAVLIGLLGFFLDGALGFRPLLPKRLRWPRLGPVIVLGLAGIEELGQMLSPVRTASLADFAADLLGVLLLSALALRLARRLDTGRPGP